jgi:serine phosphatase RsbU (regulator of sigma subunit)
MKLGAVLAAVALVPMGVALYASGSVLRSTSEDAGNDARDVARTAMKEALRREAKGLVAALSEQAKSPLVTYDFAVMHDLVHSMGESPNVAAVRIYDAEGYLVADGSNRPAARRIRRDGSVPSGEQFVETEDALRATRTLEVAGRSIGHVEVEFKVESAIKADRALAQAIARRHAEGAAALQRATTIASISLGLFALLVAWVVGRRLTRPILALRDGTSRLAAGDLDVRVQVNGDDELAELATGFNVMASELVAAQLALAEQARISREMEIAERIQTSLIPKNPLHPDFEFAGRMDPADEVGGDFYDILSDRKEALWLTIGDVSSHGLASGLVMLMTQSAFSTAWAGGPKQDPSHVLQQVNMTLFDCVHERMGDNKYLTGLVFCHRGQGRFEYAGAHLWPLVYRRRTRAIEELPVEGAWLGVAAEIPHHSVHELVLEPGDVLCLYTDGVIETMNEAGEQFDMSRLRDSFARAMRSAEHGFLTEATDAILSEVDAFSSERSDDRTLLLVRRRASA